MKSISLLSIITLSTATCSGLRQPPPRDDGDRPIDIVKDRADHCLMTPSPDGRLAVWVPKSSLAGGSIQNKIVEVKSGRVFAVLPKAGYLSANHQSVAGRWSKDGSVLEWTVTGKWTPDAVTFTKIKDGAVVWSRDIKTTCDEAILSRCRKAAPSEYARRKEENAGSGSAYPDGFTVDVRPGDHDAAPVKLPMKICIDMTSDPKDAGDGKPLTAWLDAILEEDGQLTIGACHLGSRPGLKNSWASP